MTPANELTQKVKSILAQEWGVTAASIPDQAALNEYEKWDSLGHITIMLALEKEFGIEVTSDNIQGLSSISNITTYLKAHAKPSPPPS